MSTRSGLSIQRSVLQEGRAFKPGTHAKVAPNGAESLFFFVLLLNASGTFRFVAPVANVLMPRHDLTIGDVSIALLFLNLCYLAVRAQYIMPLLRGGLSRWLLVIVVWPAYTSLYSPNFALRELGVTLYVFSLMCGAAVYTMVAGLPSLRRLLAFSLAITVVGFVLSMIAPQYFESVALLADGRIDYDGRSFGFFMQPNRAARSLAFLFVGWFALSHTRNTFAQTLAIVGFIGMMLLTGSRTGAVLAGVIVMMIVLSPQRPNAPGGRHMLRIVSLVMCFLIAQAGVNLYVMSQDGAHGPIDNGLIKRVSMLLNFKLTNAESVANDLSVQERVDGQAVYWELIAERPFLGHGFGAEVLYLEEGPLILTAHSDLIKYTMECGVLYPLAFYLLVFLFWRKPARRAVEMGFGTNAILQCVFAAVALFTINGGLLQTRAFCVVWGMFFAIVACPQYVLTTEKDRSDEANLRCSTHVERGRRGPRRIRTTSTGRCH